MCALSNPGMEKLKKEIEKLVSKVKVCKKCSLAPLALKGVVYRGIPKENVVVFVGEAPGIVEDLQGLPFVGPSGKMLDDLIKECGITEFYITNIVKHISRKGSGVRPPTSEEIQACSEYIKRELELLKPKLIVALGSVAFEFFTGLKGIIKHYGQIFDTEYGKLLALPHPSYYLHRGVRKYLPEDIDLIKTTLKNLQQETLSDEYFCPLHLHTTYSIGDGFGTPGQFADRFKELNIKAAAITDHGTLAGVVEWTRALSKNGIKPILGIEFYITHSEKGKRNYHVTCLAKNQVGWRNLLELHYLANTKYFYYKPRIPFEEFLKYQEGLIVLTGCPSTPFAEREDWLKQLIEVKRGEDIYVELQPLKKFKDIFNLMLKRAEKYNLPVIITNDVHYVKPEDIELRNLAVQIVRKDETFEGFSENIHYVMNYEEVLQRTKEFGWPEEALANTVKLANSVEFVIQPFTSFPLPDFGYQIEDICQPEPENQERWNLELDRIKRKGYDKYFLLIRKIQEIAKKNDIWYGPGRGSVGGSYVAYKLGIHEVDPHKYDLIFDRFLSEARTDCPDIDIDFEHIKQAELIELIKQELSNVARIGTYSTWKEKSAYNDLVKITNEERARELVPYFQMQIRHRGLHAAGIVVSGEPLYTLVPLERYSDQLVVAWDRDSLDYMRIPKVDILGLKVITVLREVAEATGTQMPRVFDDSRVYKEIFQKGKLKGVFQFGTELMASVCKYVDCFNDLVLISALMRPGAGGQTETWIKLKTGKARPVYYNEKFKEITKETLGLIVYQEQVMKIVHEIGGMSWEQAEEFRKVTAKTGDKQVMDKYREQFIKGATKNGLETKLAEKLYNYLLEFAGYSFNKSHAVFYSMLGYWTAWAKLYYPKEFYLATLKYEADLDKANEIVSELKQLNYKFEGPDVNRSDVYFSFNDGCFRIGLSSIKGIGEDFARKIVSLRPYRSLFEFVAKVKPNSAQIKALAAVGALDKFGYTRNYVYSNAETIAKGVVATFEVSRLEWSEQQKEVMLRKYLTL